MKTNSRWVLAVAVAVTIVLGGGPIRAQFNFGPEFQVNTYTFSSQDDPDTCFLDDGSFVVVWEGYNSRDGEGDGIFGQRYSGEGAPLGLEFQVNTYTTTNQREPALCCSGSGFVVAWASAPNDGDQGGVFAQRFATAGSPVGGEFQVNTYTAGFQGLPAICCDAGGSFVVAWESSFQDGESIGVFAQGFASGGAPVGAFFQVNTYTTNSQADPAICCDGAGGFVVVWRSYVQDGGDAGIFGQGFSSPGVPDGAEFQVNTVTAGGQYEPDVCCDGVGFTVVWQTPDGDGAGIAARRYSAPASPLGSEFPVNSDAAGDQLSPSICCDLEGFAVVWELGTGAATEPLVGRTFDASGVALSQEFVVGDYPDSDADDPAVACDAEGNVLVAWETDSDDTPARDGSGEGVFARLLSEPVTILEVPTLGGWGIGLLAAALAAGGAAFLRRR